MNIWASFQLWISCGLDADVIFCQNDIIILKEVTQFVPNILKTLKWFSSKYNFGGSTRAFGVPNPIVYTQRDFKLIQRREWTLNSKKICDGGY